MSAAPAPEPAGPSRRSVLAGVGTGVVGVLAAGALGGCTSPTPAAPPAPPDPDEAVREAAAARERGLLTAYAAALSARPEQAALLSGLRAQHEVHLAQLTGPQPSASASSASAPSPSDAPGAPAAAPPPSSPQDLVRLEREGAAAHTAAALAAVDGALAALLASLAASEASHPTALV